MFGYEEIKGQRSFEISSRRNGQVCSERRMDGLRSTQLLYNDHAKSSMLARVGDDSKIITIIVKVLCK